MSTSLRDRFDDVPRTTGRVGAHRAEDPRMNGWVALLWAVVAAGILIIGGTFAMFVVTGRIALFPAAGPTVVSESGETGIVGTDYTVLILNGTPEEGLDARMRDDIVNAGWNGADVFAGPSGTTDFEETTIYFVDEADQAAAVGLADVIGGAELARSDHYANPDDPDARQLTIVIGLDRTDAQSDPEDTTEG